jgi:hypothetical protein
MLSGAPVPAAPGERPLVRPRGAVAEAMGFEPTTLRGKLLEPASSLCAVRLGDRCDARKQDHFSRRSGKAGRSALPKRTGVTPGPRGHSISVGTGAACGALGGGERQCRTHRRNAGAIAGFPIAGTSFYRMSRGVEEASTAGPRSPSVTDWCGAGASCGGK